MTMPDRAGEAPILIVEDSFSDYACIIRAFRKLNMENPVYHCGSGDRALDFLHEGKAWQEMKGVRPALILLDLNLPDMDGREVLKEIKGDERLKSIPVTIFSTSTSDRDVRECYLHGANSYMTKPLGWENFCATIGNFRSWWLEAVMLPEAREAGVRKAS